MAQVKVTDTEIRNAVTAVIQSGNWPIDRQQDDRGLEEREYFEFVRDVLRKLGRVNSFE